jgi:GGDEF domain-containing protein
VCGRIGGDEFAVVLTGGLIDATLARDRIVAALREAGISATGGIAVARGGRRLRHLYADADAALLAAKCARTRAAGASPLLGRRKEVESIDELNVA